MKHLLLITVLLLSGCQHKTYHRAVFDAQGNITEEVRASLTSCMTQTEATDIVVAADKDKRALLVGKFMQRPDEQAIKAAPPSLFRWLAAFFGFEVGL